MKKKPLKPIPINKQLIAACGLYCGACMKYRRGKCAGCLTGGFARCKIRTCCHEKGYHTCAQCDKDVKDCQIHNNLIGRLFALFFNSDRAACIHYIRHRGEDAFAQKMAWDKQMTIKKR